MATNKRSPGQSEKSYQQVSLGIFGIEIYNSGNLAFNFFFDPIKAIEADGDNAMNLAILVYQLLKTDFGARVSKHITDNLDVCQHPKAGEFKYRFIIQLNELIKKNNIAVPATRVFSDD